jgi:hypothetical protein
MRFSFAAMPIVYRARGGYDGPDRVLGMAANEYHFVTRWRVPGTAEAAFDAIADVPGYLCWWPSVYLSVSGSLTPAGAHWKLHTRGRLPYTLRWEAHTIESVRPLRIVLLASGDFEGRGCWTVVQDGAFVNLTFDWRISAEKALIRYLSFLFKPLFAANHRWAMAQGEAGLRRYLSR